MTDFCKTFIYLFMFFFGGGGVRVLVVGRRRGGGGVKRNRDKHKLLFGIYSKFSELMLA